MKALLALPAPFWGIRGILTVFLAPAYPFCHFIMLSPISGNLLVAGPGGVWVFDPTGKRLEIIETPETPANIAWGDADGRTLYITARTSVYKVRVPVGGKYWGR